jgi:hypothetical protein
MFRRYAFVFLLIAAWFFADKAAALATCKLVYIDNSDDNLDRPVNKDQCDRNVEIEFEIAGTAAAKYEIYIGTQCTKSGLSDTDCKLIESNFTISGNGTENYSFPVQNLLEADGFTCEEGTYTVVAVFVPTGTTGDASVTSTSGAITCSKDIDTEPPAAPTNPRGGSGEREITVKWDFDFTNYTDLEKFTVYYEACPGKSGLCDKLPSSCTSSASISATSSSDVDGGSDSSEAINLSALDSKSASNATQITLTKLVDLDQRAAIVIVAQDTAGNTSSASNVTCIEGVATLGFCDLMKKEGKSCEKGCTVDTVDVRGTPSTITIAVMSMALLIFSLRRRRGV